MNLSRAIKFLFVPLVLPASLCLADDNPASDVSAAIVEMDAAMAVLAKLRPTPATDEALMHLTRARVRLVDVARRVGTLVPAAQMPVNLTIKLETPPSPPPPSEPPRKMLPRAPEPISAAQLADLIQSLKRISFGDERLKVLREAAKRHRFLTAQVREIVKEFSFGGEKAQAAGLLYPRVLDKPNFYQIYQDFPFESDREDLRKRVEKWDRTGLPDNKEDLD